MEFQITLKNYRCFEDVDPVEITFRPGFTSLIGVNNSGKSTLLRFLFEFRGLFQQLRPDGINHLLQGQPFAMSPPQGIFDNTEIFCHNNERPLSVSLRILDAQRDEIDEVSLEFDRANPFVFRADFRHARKSLTTIGLTRTGQEEVQVGGTSQNLRLTALFRVVETLADSLYVGPFRNILNVGTNTGYFDIRTGQAFVEQWRMMKTGGTRRENEAAAGVQADIARLFGFGHIEINAFPGDSTLSLLIDGRSLKLPEVGSGIAQFVLVLANVSMRPPALILIDEPELNLHPSLQVDFLTTLGSYARFGVVFGTHNVGLARAVGDTIYALRTVDGHSEVRPFDERNPSLSEVLGELSFSGYRALGFSSVLLIEGRTDVKTVQQFLRQYDVDHKVVVIPLGGEEMITEAAEDELRELTRLSDKIFALIDSERQKAGERISAKRQGFINACERANIRCKVLDRRALENYLADSAVRRAFGPGAHALSPFADPKTTTWNKRENWRAARLMTKGELAGTDLDAFFGEVAASVPQS